MTEHPEDQPSEVAGQTPTVSEPAAAAVETPTELPVEASPPQDDDTATASESNLREQSSALLERLVETFPAAFFPFTARQVKPLKIGIHKDLEPSLKAWGFAPAVLKIALSRYTRARRYQVALLKETQRLDLQGQEAGEVSDENRQIAQTRIDALNEKRKQQQAAIKAAKAASSTPATATPNPGRPRPRNEPRKPQRQRKARDPRAVSRSSQDDTTTSDVTEQVAKPNTTEHQPHTSPPRRHRPPKQKKPSGPREPTAEKLAALAAKFNSR